MAKRKSKNKLKRKNTGAVIFTVFCLAAGGMMGFVSAMMLDGALGENNFLLELAIELLLIFAAFGIQTIMHETGHLLAGLASGYKFSSFRIGSLMLVKEGEKLSLKRHYLAGTGGQCLMIPPSPDADGKIPVVLYNLGGVMVNLISAAVFITVGALLYRVSAVLGVFFILLGESGIIIGIMNGVPFKLGTVNNDGRNALDLKDNAEAMRVFYAQLSMLDYLSRGKRLREMPSELFFVPSDEGMQNGICASGAVFYENLLMDRGEYAEALELINKLLSGKNALIGLHRSILIGDKITLLLINGENERADHLYSGKEYSAIAKQMKNSISYIRVEYAHALLSLKDTEGAEVIRARFEKSIKSHPYPSDVLSERELMDEIDRASHKLY